MSSRTIVATALAAVLTIAACDGKSTGPEDQDALSARADAIASFLMDIDATGGAGYGLNLDPRTGTRSFTRTVPCPAGGTISLSGGGSSTLDATTQVLTTSWTTTQVHDRCAFDNARGGHQLRVVIDGSVTSAGAASYQLPLPRAGGRVLLAYTNTRAGSTTTTAGDHTRTCVIDVTESYNPANGTFTITGIICGREVNVTRGVGQKTTTRST